MPSLSVGSASFTLRLAIGQLGLNLVELIQPVSGDTLYSRRLDEEGPGLHHLAGVESAKPGRFRDYILTVFFVTRTRSQFSTISGGRFAKRPYNTTIKQEIMTARGEQWALES